MDDSLLPIEPEVDAAYEASLVKVVPPDDPGKTGLGDPQRGIYRLHFEHAEQ